MTDTKKQEGYLKPNVHANLIRQLKFISDQTRIPEAYIRGVGAKEFCSEAEMAWIRNVKKHIREVCGGIILHGKQNVPVAKKMLAIGATLVRNFVDARIYPVSTLMSLMDDRYAEVPECTVLIIPDLCTEGFLIPNKQIHKLYGLLLERFVANKMIIGYVDNLDSVSLSYGSTFADHIKEHYDLFEGNCTDKKIEVAV